MAKGKSTGFFCQNCGYESAKWMGQCPACREWNTFVEEPVGKSSGGHGNASVRREQVPEPVKLSGISTENSPRTSSGMKELDRVLGGGIVPGSLILVGGDSGIGKSTLLLQTCRLLSQKEEKVLYVSGEESARQIKMRAERIGDFTDSLYLLSETSMGSILRWVDEVQPTVMVVTKTVNHWKILWLRCKWV